MVWELRLKRGVLVCDFLVFSAPGSHFPFIRKARHMHFSGISVAWSTERFLDSPPALAFLFCSYTVKEFPQTQCPAVPQHSQEITPSKGRYLYGIKLCPALPHFRISHFLRACHSAIGHTPKREEQRQGSAFPLILKLPLRNCDSYLKNRTE